MTQPPSHLAALRGLMPQRALSFAEALQRAELQASRLLELAGVSEAPVPEFVITEQPRVLVSYSYDLKGSGSSEWQAGAWRIQLNALEPDVRHRFTLAHEYKHVLDAPFDQQIYARLRSDGEHHPFVEQVCDYFAACLLMPKRLIKRAWGEGPRDVQTVAEMFAVSAQAMQIRLITLGLVDRPGRCQRPVTPPSVRRGGNARYWRRATTPLLGVAA